MTEGNTYAVDLDKAYEAWSDWYKAGEHTDADADLAADFANWYGYELIRELRNARVTLDEDKKYMSRQDAKYDRLAARYTRELDEKDAKIERLKLIARVSHGLYVSAEKDASSFDGESVLGWRHRALAAEKALADKTAEWNKLMSVAQKRYNEIQEWRRLADTVKVVHKRTEER